MMLDTCYRHTERNWGAYSQKLLRMRRKLEKSSGPSRKQESQRERGQGQDTDASSEGAVVRKQKKETIAHAFRKGKSTGTRKEKENKIIKSRKERESASNCDESKKTKNFEESTRA